MRARSSRLIALAVLAAACSSVSPSAAPEPASLPPTSTTTIATTTTTAESTTTGPPVTTTSTTTTAATTSTTVSPFAPPEWLGTRVLPVRPDGFGEIQPTPQELIGRAFATVDDLPPPVGSTYVATIDPVPADVVARSTWRDECPVTLDELRYVTVAHHGFDGRLHTGELIVNAAVAEDIAWVFGELFAAGYPIEQLRVTTLADLDAPPTGDGNGSGAFSCRPVAGRSSGWSQHAYGLAVDINPFQNPYLKGDLVIPELASYYLDRSLEMPGMIAPDSAVVEAFAAIGWKWGGDWTSLKDWMHFSRNGH